MPKTKNGKLVFGRQEVWVTKYTIYDEEFYKIGVTEDAKEAEGLQRVVPESEKDAVYLMCYRTKDTGKGFLLVDENEFTGDLLKTAAGSLIKNRRY